MPRRSLKCFKPTVSDLESRAILTVMGVQPALSDVVDLAQTLAAQSSTPAPTPPVPPLIPGPGQPLPNELARTRFAASFGGPFLSGPPRYTGESAILNYRGLGTSTQFLHGDYQMAIVLPNDPAATITGAAFMQDKNLTGGNEVGLDINFDRTTLDGRGRPTQGTWVTDPNIYSGANFFNSGSGTVQIRYSRNGTAATFFRGHIYTNGITNILRNTNLHPAA
jgi:hypothetical protein